MSYPAVKIGPKLMTRLWIDRAGPSFIDLTTTIDDRGLGLRATVRIAPKEGRSAIVLYDELPPHLNHKNKTLVEAADGEFVIKLEKMSISIGEPQGEEFSITISFQSEDISISLRCRAPREGVENFLKIISKLER